ncbi:2-oxo acid dehydrogenase subunit E2 [Mycobacterium sp. Y57]|uniref:dihydrolipoamide acetyltransferase family protein n=1 Tax=Mycolicibacterium xanthum TaxID=2796469 RepID=UPI001C85FBE6|nr:dihydrolipoamide acetyltransferase family protein [Mycolicibacterium xanthum]MBX7434847.1 2-oxo acid dehydrogenase subunit E2 [Mycolicibacterium xanthum]
MTETVRDFLVPDLGEGLEDATVTEWAVAVGDHVELNQPLCTVETNKAQVEIPSPYAGRVVELGGAEGQVLDVGAVLVRIATQPESDVSPEARPESDVAPESEAGPDVAPVPDDVSPQPIRRPVLVGYGADDAMDSSRRRPVRRPRAAPRTRKLAADLRVDLARVPASGGESVITREDVLAAAERGAPPSGTVPVHGVQAAMAHRMSMSRKEIPDAHTRVEVDCTGLLRMRDRLREQADADAPVTPFVLVLRLLSMTLRRHPRLNSTWVETADGPQIHLHSTVHLGFGVAAPRGLLVPVVRDAGEKTTREFARVVARLVAESRDGTVKPAELQGSTFTVSNFGALGLDDGVPVINYPEAAIIGMGSIKPRPVVVDGAVVARPTMAMTCAFDHRLVDGAQAAAFLCDLRDLIESPELALLDL